MSIQRYGDPSHDYMTPAHDEGFLVLYTDHVAAVAAARTEEVLNRDSVWGDGYSQAMHDAFGDMSMEEFVAAAEQRGYVRGYEQRNADMPAVKAQGVVEGLRMARDVVAAAKAEFIRITDATDDSWACRIYDDALAAIDALLKEKP